MASVRKALAYTIAGSNLGFVIQFLSTVVLARLLTPAEIGIYSVGAVFTNIAIRVRDFGVGEYIIQEPNLTPEKIRSALTLNFLTSWSVMLLLLLLEDVVGTFYAEPAVGHVIGVIAIALFFMPFGVVTQAYLRRNMQFAAMFWISLSSTTCGAATSVALALLGHGVLSLAWGTVAGVAATAITCIFFRPKELRYFAGLGSMLKVSAFGLQVTWMYIGHELAQRLPDMVIGRTAGMVGAGLFSRATGLLEITERFLTSAIRPLILPMFAIQHRGGTDVSRDYLRSIALMTGVGWPLLAFIAGCAPDLVALLYGDQWHEAVLLLRILTVSIALDFAFSMVFELLIATGHVRAGTRLQLTMLVVRVLAVVIGAPFGLIAICSSLVVSSAINVFITVGVLRSTIDIATRRVLHATLRSSAVAAVVFAGTYLTSLESTQSSHLWVTLVAACVAGLLWSLTARVLHHEAWDLLWEYAGRLDIVAIKHL